MYKSIKITGKYFILCIYKNKYAHRNEFVMNLQSDARNLRKQKLFSEEFLERDYKESSMDGQYAMSANSIH